MLPNKARKRQPAGRPRGELTIKIRAAVDGNGLPVQLEFTASEAHILAAPPWSRVHPARISAAASPGWFLR